jgi:hypothetical protein
MLHTERQIAQHSTNLITPVNAIHNPHNCTIAATLLPFFQGRSDGVYSQDSIQHHKATSQATCGVLTNNTMRAFHVKIPCPWGVAGSVALGIANWLRFWHCCLFYYVKAHGVRHLRSLSPGAPEPARPHGHGQKVA